MKIITAISSPELNTKLKELNKYEIGTLDISYQEGVIEILEKQKDIKIIILSENLQGEYKLNEFIYLIKNISQEIKIIIILENKTEEKTKFLLSQNINNIFLNNDTTITEIINAINKEETNIKKEDYLTEEIKKLKTLILENNKIKENKIQKIKYNKIINKAINIKNKIKSKIHKSKFVGTHDCAHKIKIISIAGPQGVGKSIFTACLAKEFKYSKNKILIIDFDILNNNLNTIYGLKKFPQNKKEKILSKLKINKFIIKLNKNTHLLCATEILFGKKENIDTEKIEYILEQLKQEYNYIFIDSSSDCIFKYTKAIFEKSDKIIFLTGSNLLQIQKAKQLLKIYLNEWNINKNKFGIIYNKYNINSIDTKILNNIFEDFEILGKLKLKKQYEILINKNMKQKTIKIKFKKEYKTIIMNLFKDNKIKA